MFNVVSLFSGCGGMDLGFTNGFSYLNKAFEELPFRVVWANDRDRFAMEVYNHNFGTCFEPSDIRGIRFNELDIGGSAVDVLIAGFPCQEFSLSGPRNGLNSERGSLYTEIRRALNSFNPRVFMAENVPGIQHPPSILETIKAGLSEGTPKYDISVFQINAADFGVPQIRRRVVLIGVRSDIVPDFVPPERTHRPPSLEKNGSNLPTWIRTIAGRDTPAAEDFPIWLTVDDAIGDLWNPSGTWHSDIPDQEKRTCATIELDRRGRRDRRLRSDLPSPTIRAQHHGHVEVHYGEQGDGNLRRLTIRECARIQSFPDDFVFPVSASQAYVQIGNAMPPVVVHYWAQAIADLLQASGHVPCGVEPDGGKQYGTG